MRNFLILIFACVLVLRVEAQPCGIPCLHSQDKQLLQQGRNTTLALFEDFKKFDREKDQVNLATAPLLLRRVAGWTKEYYEEYL